MKRTACIAAVWIAASAAAQAGNLGGFWAWWRASDAGESDGIGLKLTLTEPGTTSALELRLTVFSDLSRDTEPNKLKVTPIEIGPRFPIAQDGPLQIYLGLGGGYYLMDFDNRRVGDEFGFYGLLGIEFQLGDTFVLFGEAVYRRVKARPEGGDLDLDGIGANVGIAYSW